MKLQLSRLCLPHLVTASLRHHLLPAMSLLLRQAPGLAWACAQSLSAAQHAAWRMHQCRSVASAQPSTIEVSRHASYAVVQLNRPKALNALSTQVMQELVAAAHELDRDPRMKAIVVTGSGKAFAAGADIKEMADLTQQKAAEKQLFAGWQDLKRVRKPLIAAVNGYALGGGCELAMLCDIIIASEAAVFGQPELSLGVTPGIGGTQRLTRLIGRARAMDCILIGRRLSAQEALAAGLVSRVVPAESLMQEAEAIAHTIASYSAPAVAAAKACVHAVDEVGLQEGIRVEQRAFWGCFDHADQKEGMAAFVEKRKPVFKDA